VAGPSLTMKLPCVGETRAPPMATPFRPARSTSAPADHGIPSGIRSRPGSGFRKTQPALGDSSGCVRLRYASDWRAVARSAAGSHLAAAGTDDQSANARVGHEHVRSAAEDGHADALAARESQRRDDLVGTARLDQPFRRTADLEGRQRRERDVRPYPIGAERQVERRAERRHDGDDSTAMSARSCAMSAASASRGVQTTKEIASPGDSWPATAMSAVMTVAIFG